MKHQKELEYLVETLRNDEFDWELSMWQWRHPDNKLIGCAIGLYCHLHPKSELHMVLREDGFWAPAYYQYNQYNAVAKYFDISYPDATYLFSQGRYPGTVFSLTRKMVANRIEQYQGHLAPFVVKCASRSL